MKIQTMDSQDDKLKVWLKHFKKIPGMSWANPAGTVWFFALGPGDTPIGVAAMAPMRDGSIRFKSAAVLSEYRGKGVYRALSEARLGAARDLCYSKATAFCGEESWPQLRKDGFAVQSVSKKGVKYVVKVL